MSAGDLKRLEGLLEELLSLSIAFSEGSALHAPEAINEYVETRARLLAASDELSLRLGRVFGVSSERFAGLAARILAIESEISTRYTQQATDMLSEIAGNRVARRALHGYQDNSGNIGVVVADLKV